MWLYSGTKSYAGWAYSISNKIRRIVPAAILAMVIATLVSQLTLLLASLLPLKIILLIGSPGVPRYFPQSFAAFDRDALVVGLGAAAVGFYLIHLMAERFIAFNNERASGRVLERAGKLTLFANQEEMARGAIRKLARGMANAIFVLAALALIAFIHPSVSLVLVGWCALIFAGTSIAGALNPAYQEWLQANAKSFIGSMATIGIFVVVASIIAEFLLGASFNILFAVVSLILSRQVLQLLVTSIKEALTLNAQKQQINALFFQGHALAGQAPARDDGLWDLCRAKRLDAWLAPYIAEVTGRPAGGIRMTDWRETGLTDILTFRVSVAGAEGDGADYLIKLYSNRRRTLAAHEATLLSAVPPDSLPCPAFLGARRVGEANCHLFRYSRASHLRPKEIKEKKRAFLQACWLYEPPGDLVRRYRRSHQLLPQQLSAQMGERLMQVALTPQNENAVRDFIKAVGPIRERLEALPLFVHCLDSGVGTLLETEGGQIVATEWGRWTLEPVGAGWPTAKAALAAIGPWLEEARGKRRALANVTAEQTRLAALAFAFQRLYARQRYNSALRLLPAMISCADAAGVTEADHAAPKQAGTALRKTGS
ncbi:hypothetical protein [Chelativorans salis]|uniref:ABC transmembrane type-1 domain-containing protein n=1 Tax=Chelativorans salis TaxID=2978478 RepID=A0ABT2LV02_9HYPH|nr:hypothetical protein [Chelativorans sp. EGI FJ00035]MCT7378211.1 hypothetical protein [Chelativorans sp. EGI FJ00035]